jgi:hypothetical protein
MTAEEHAALLDAHDVLVAANQDMRLRAEVEREAFEDLLGDVWLYIDWRYVTRRLTNEQKELFADSVDASNRRSAAVDRREPTEVERWWRS